MMHQAMVHQITITQDPYQVQNIRPDKQIANYGGEPGLCVHIFMVILGGNWSELQGNKVQFLFCNISSEKHLHDQLVTSKKLKEAVMQLDGCLRKMNTSLDDTQLHIYGDLHTVYTMIDDHKVCICCCHRHHLHIHHIYLYSITSL